MDVWALTFRPPSYANSFRFCYQRNTFMKSTQLATATMDDYLLSSTHTLGEADRFSLPCNYLPLSLLPCHEGGIVKVSWFGGRGGSLVFFQMSSQIVPVTTCHITFTCCEDC